MADANIEELLKKYCITVKMDQDDVFFTFAHLYHIEVKCWQNDPRNYIGTPLCHTRIRKRDINIISREWHSEGKVYKSDDEQFGEGVVYIRAGNINFAAEFKSNQESYSFINWLLNV